MAVARRFPSVTTPMFMLVKMLIVTSVAPRSLAKMGMRPKVAVHVA